MFDRNDGFFIYLGVAVSILAFAAVAVMLGAHAWITYTHPSGWLPQ